MHSTIRMQLLPPATVDPVELTWHLLLVRFRLTMDAHVKLGGRYPWPDNSNTRDFALEIVQYLGLLLPTMLTLDNEVESARKAWYPFMWLALDRQNGPYAIALF